MKRLMLEFPLKAIIWIYVWVLRGTAFQLLWLRIVRLYLKGGIFYHKMRVKYLTHKLHQAMSQRKAKW